MRGSCANLAFVDKRSDMMRTHRVMAVFADNPYRFYCCNPVVAHGGVSLYFRMFTFTG